MSHSETLISALRAVSSVPELGPDELQKFSASIDKDAPLPDSSYEDQPVWRVAPATAPPFFAALTAQASAHPGLVSADGFAAVGLTNVTVITTENALRLILDQIANTALTGAEFRLALQMLEGLDLKAAAAQDATGYETKRTQFKSLAGKLNARGQSEVVRVLTTQVMQVFAGMAQTSDMSELDAYAARYLPRDVRRLSLMTPAGVTVPVLDYGPLDGAPMVVLHPMLFPPLGPAEIEQANGLGLRLIWPLRPGLLDAKAPLRRGSDHLAQSVDGLLAVLTQMIGRPAPVLAFVSSGAVAVRAAAARPDLISRITFACTCYSAGRSTVSIPYFGAELVELALRSEAIMTRTVAALRRYVGSDARFRAMTMRTFRKSARDTAHLQAEFDGPDSGARLKMVTLQSPESIRHDFFNQTQFCWSELAALSVPRRFLHGADDSIHPPDKLAAILERLGEPPLSIAPDMGHLPQNADLRDGVAFAASWPDP